MLAIPWYLIQLPNGPTLNATMVAVVTLASLFWGMYAGTLIDRYNRKHLILGYNGIDGVLLIGAGLLGISLGVTPFWVAAGIYTLTIFTYNLHYPNLYAFVQELFEREQYAKVNSAIEIQGQTTSFLGMMAAGLLIEGSPDLAWWPQAWEFAAWELHEIFLLDGGTYFLSFLLITQIPYERRLTQVDKGPVLQRLQQGFGYLQANRPILIFGVASYVVFFSLLVMVQVVMPVYVKDYLEANAAVLSFFKGSYSLGAIAAGLLGLSQMIKSGHLVRQIIFLLGVAMAAYTILTVTQSVSLTLLSALLLGLANAGTRILRITYLVRIVPNAVIGRVNAFFSVINVVMRTTFIALLALPFFSGAGNGPHMVVATALLGLVMLLAAITLLWKMPQFATGPASEPT